MADFLSPEDEKKILSDELVINNPEGLLNMFPQKSGFDDAKLPEDEVFTETVLSNLGGGNSFKDMHLNASLLETQQRTRAIEAATYGFPNRPSTYKGLISEIVNAPYMKYTDGQALAKNIKHPEHSKKEISKAGRDFDIALAKNYNIKGLLENLEENSYEDLMNKPDEAIYQTAKNIVRNNARGTKKIEEDYESHLFNNNDFLDVLEHANPIGGEDPKGMDFELWEMAKDIVSGDFVYSDFDKKMESNYGNDWESRWGWFIAKEAAIDGLLLWAAMTPLSPLAGYLKVARTASLGSRFMAAVSRSAVIGIGGGSAQVVQNAMLDRDLNIAPEMIGRFGAGLGGEALIKGVSVGIRGLGRLTGRTKKDFVNVKAEEINKKPLSNDSVSKAMNKHQFEDSVITAYTMNSLHHNLANYSKFMDDTAASILGRKEIEKSSIGNEIKGNLSKLLGVDKRSLDNIEIDAIMSDITELGNRYERLSLPKFRNQNATSKGLSYRLLGMARGEYENFSKDLEMHFSNANLVLRKTDEGINKSSNSVINTVLKFLRVPESTKVAFQSASNYLSARNFSSKVSNGLARLYRSSVKGLNKDDLNVLDTMLKEGDANHKIFDRRGTVTPSGFDPTKVSDKIFKAYTKLRVGMDIAYEILDKSKVNALKGDLTNIKYGKVFKSGKKYYQINRRTANKKGEWNVMEFDRDSLSVVGDAIDISPSKLREINTIIKYRNGHIPRVYRPHTYSVVVINPGKGVVNREFITNSGVEAAKYARERNELLDPNSEMAIQFYNNMDTGFNGIRMNRSSMNILSAVDETQREVVHKFLSEQGLPSDSVNFIFKGLHTPRPTTAHGKELTELGTAFTEVGRKLRLDLAKAVRNKEGKAAEKIIKDKIKKELKVSGVPTRDSIVDYFGTIANNAGYDNWRVFAIDDWNVRYGKYLNVEVGASYNKPEFVIGTPHKIQKEAKRYGKWIERNISQRTFVEKKMDQGLAHYSRYIAEKALDGNITAKALSKVADNLPIQKTLYGSLRFAAAFPKLLFLNIPQVLIQGSQVVVSSSAAAAKNPVLAVKSLSRLPAFTFFQMARLTNKNLPRSITQGENYKIFKELIQAGYASDLHTTDTLFGMSNHMNPGWSRWVVEKVKVGGALPFRLGEGFNRVSAFITVRDQIAHAIKRNAKLVRRGKTLTDDQINEVKGFNGKQLLEDDIGSHEFREAVVNKAQVLALNMGKAGELEVMSGPGSVLLQFKQVLPKEISVFDSTLLTAREKWGAAAGMVSFWGMAGIPLASDLLNVADYYQWDKKDPKSRLSVSDYLNSSLNYVAESIEDGTGGFISEEFVRNIVRKGGLYALSDGEINIISRVALGNFVSDMVDVQDKFDYVVSFAVLRDFIDMVDSITGLHPEDALHPVEAVYNIASFFEVLNRVKGGESFETAMSHQFKPESIVGRYLAGQITGESASYSALREFGKVWSQFGSFSRIVDSNNRDVIQPEAHMFNPLAPTYYTSSGLTGLPVEKNNFRDAQFWLGITPGKIVEEYDKLDLQHTYNTALSEFRKDVIKRYKNASGDIKGASQTRIYNEAVEKMYVFKEHMRDLDLDDSTAKDVEKSLINQFMGTEMQTFTGGMIK